MAEVVGAVPVCTLLSCFLIFPLGSRFRYFHHLPFLCFLFFPFLFGSLWICCHFFFIAVCYSAFDNRNVSQGISSVPAVSSTCHSNFVFNPVFFLLVLYLPSTISFLSPSLIYAWVWECVIPDALPFGSERCEAVCASLYSVAVLFHLNLHFLAMFCSPVLVGTIPT